MTFFRHQSGQLSLYIDDNCIEKVTKQKLLGVFIDENLSWAAHIDHLCSLISTKISLLKQLTEYVPQNIQKLFYQSYILPLFDNGCNNGAPHQVKISKDFQNCKNELPAIFCKLNSERHLLLCSKSSDG